MVVLPQVRQPQLAKRGDICDDPRCLRKGAWIESWGLGHGRDLATAGSENHRKSPKIDWSTGKHHHLPWFTMVYHHIPYYFMASLWVSPFPQPHVPAIPTPVTFVRAQHTVTKMFTAWTTAYGDI